MLNVQIGRVMMKGRFIITEHLNTSPVLIGSDFMVKNQLSNSFYSNNNWYCCIGPVDNPLGKVPTVVTSKICLTSQDEINFEPFECKRITLSRPQGKILEKSEFSGIQTEFLKNTPLKILSCNRESIELQNISPLNTLLLSDSPLVEGTFRSSQINVEEIANEFPEQELEDILEPGMPIGNIIDKNEELDYVRNHDRIPQEIKPALLEFLEQNDELFSGEEFSSKHFPAEKYMHDVELIEPLKELKSKPFPCAGIRLQHLKETIDTQGG